MNARAAAIAAAAERSLGAGSAGVEKGVADLSMAEGLPSETAAAAPSASASAATNAAASTGDRFNLLPREDGSAEAADGASKDDDDAPEAPQAEEVSIPFFPFCLLRVIQLISNYSSGLSASGLSH